MTADAMQYPPRLLLAVLASDGNQRFACTMAVRSPLKR